MAGVSPPAINHERNYMNRKHIVSSVVTNVNTERVSLSHPPYSNTGGKVFAPRGIEIESIDKSRAYVLVDWCSFTFPPYHLNPVDEIERVLESSTNGLKVELIDLEHGWLGFKNSYEIWIETGAGWQRVGKVGYGGNGDKCHVSLTGSGCALVEDWSPIQYLLDSTGGKLTRVDIALDDFEGNHNLNEIRELYSLGGFNCGGRTPSFQYIENSDNRGDTINIGNRESGKFVRCYEKGRQLGDTESKWLRVEVELRDKDRVLPYDILSNPVKYLAGAIPWIASAYNLIAEKIKTIKNKAKLTLNQVLNNAKNQVGKVIGWLHSCGVSSDKIVSRLMRDGVPRRLELAGIFEALVEAKLLPDCPF
jgi:phage replication initiation protein